MFLGRLPEIGGGAFRPLFAEFLDDAAGVLGASDLKGAARLYREAGEKWTALAEALLPADVAPLAKARKLLAERRKLFHGKGVKALPRLQEIAAELAAHEAAVDEADREALAGAAGDLLPGVRERIEALRAIEEEAAEALKAGVG